MTWNDYGITIILGEYNLDLSYESIFIFFAILATIALFLFLFINFFRQQSFHTPTAIIIFQEFMFKNSQGCKWRRIPEEQTPALTKWRCKACQVEAFSADKRPPKECKKTLEVVL